MKVVGIISEILEVEKGISKTNKEWKKIRFAIKNNDGYEGKEKSYPFELFGGDKVDNFLKYNKVGSTVEVSYNDEARRWQSPNGEIKYFITYSAWKVFKAEQGTVNNGELEVAAASDDDLPF